MGYFIFILYGTSDSWRLRFMASAGENTGAALPGNML
jgi:hypothetical protein